MSDGLDTYDRARFGVGIVIFLILSILAVYGTYQLYDREARLDFREHQRARIAELETKIMELRRLNPMSRVLEQILTPLQKLELEGMDEQIRQWKIKKFQEKD